MSARSTCSVLWLFALVALAAIGPDVDASPTVLEIGSIEFPGFTLAGVRIRAELERGTRPSVNVDIGEITFGEGTKKLSDVQLRCKVVRISRARINCDDGQLGFTAGADEISLPLRFTYTPASQRLALTVNDTAAGLAQLSAFVELSDQAPSFEIAASGLEVARIAPFLYFAEEALADVDLAAGTFDFVVHGSTDGKRFGGGLTFKNLTLSNKNGSVASEKIDADMTFEMRLLDASWRGALTLAVNQGAVYAQPIYLDLKQYPLVFQAQFAYAVAARELELTHFEMHHAGVADLDGYFKSNPEHFIDELKVDATGIQFPAAYATWLSGVFVGTLLADLDTTGVASGRFEIVNGEPDRLIVEISGMDIEDRNARFALYGLNSGINWTRAGADISSSEIDWSGGSIFGADFAAATLELGIAGAAIDLLAPVRIPLLGGALAIATFSVRDYGSDELALGLEATLEPIDLGLLTDALEWPSFAGNLSGRLPLLRYSAGVVTVGGNLEARAFDGEISIENLRIEQPLGIVPAISASIRLRNLDLGQVTQVVPFGSVSGRLDGDIENLRLLKGEPVGFDARFHTPADDDSRHRLSQRAVDTIARVAGGGAALSTTFLRVFKHFAYDKLGISCRLENDVCHMDGVEAASEGYYIVKGALLPRVDLIGRVRKVQWSTLMQQLENALNEGEIRVE